MSLKLLKLRWKIYFWTMTGKIKKFQSRLQVTLTQGKPDQILIIFPSEESSFRVAYYTFRDLGKRSNSHINFVFIVKKQFKDLFHLRMGDTLFVNDNDTENVLSDEKLILRKLEKKKYDLIIDLNPNFHLGIARLVSLLSSDIKVGFESDFSDIFYNIQLNISKSGIMEKGFKQINWILAK